MSRPRRNKLGIQPTADGRSFLLTGYMLGKRVRIRSRNVAELEERKAELEGQLAAMAAQPSTPRMTWLSVEQLRDAEAAVRKAGGKSLLELVEAGESIHVGGTPVLLTDAVAEWVARLEKLRRAKVTVYKNRGRCRAFMKSLGPSVKFVHEVQNDHFEGFLRRNETPSGYTISSEGKVLHAWAEFWIMRRWVKTSPMRVDMEDLNLSAKPVELPRILTPKQAHALLKCAIADSKGMAAYVALTCWCFLRPAEALRVKIIDVKLKQKNPVIEVRPRKRGTVSFRTVDIPKNVRGILRAAVDAALAKDTPSTGRGDKQLALLPVARWGRVRWATLRGKAGLVTVVRKDTYQIVSSEIWAENILRHTGISMFYQKTGNIVETCRQAGNSSAVAFANYLNLPAEDAHKAFYEAI